MSTFVTDAKYSNIELSSLTNLLYIDDIPLLKTLPNQQYRLNIDSNRILNGVNNSTPNTVFLQPMSMSKMKNAQSWGRTMKSTSNALLFGDLDGNGSVNAIDALRVLRLFTKKIDGSDEYYDSFEKYASFNGVDRRFLAFPTDNTLTPEEVDETMLPSIDDVLKILRFSSGIGTPDVYLPPDATPLPTATPTQTPDATPDATPTPTQTPGATPGPVDQFIQSNLTFGLRVYNGSLQIRKNPNKGQMWLFGIMNISLSTGNLGELNTLVFSDKYTYSATHQQINFNSLQGDNSELFEIPDVWTSIMKNGDGEKINNPNPYNAEGNPLNITYLTSRNKDQETKHEAYTNFAVGTSDAGRSPYELWLSDDLNTTQRVIEMRKKKHQILNNLID